jgi:AcrR family transcriptional regulator
MGRPRQHDDTTRDALLAAAENLVQRGGAGALSVRAVADETGTTTRAVYSTFGSKEGLLGALAQRSFDMLREAIAGLPHTKDPARDLVQAALTVFRPMAVEHPSLFRIAFLRAAPEAELGPDAGDAARAGYELLTERVQRLATSRWRCRPVGWLAVPGRFRIGAGPVFCCVRAPRRCPAPGSARTRPYSRRPPLPL